MHMGMGCASASLVKALPLPNSERYMDRIDAMIGYFPTFMVVPCILLVIIALALAMIDSRLSALYTELKWIRSDGMPATKNSTEA